MKEKIKALTELLNGFSEVIGPDGMVAVMESLTDMNANADPDEAIAAELENSKALYEQLSADFEAEKAARAAEKADYAKKLAQLITGELETGDEVEDVPNSVDEETVNGEDIYELLFDEGRDE